MSLPLRTRSSGPCTLFLLLALAGLTGACAPAAEDVGSPPPAAGPPAGALLEPPPPTAPGDPCGELVGWLAGLTAADGGDPSVPSASGGEAHGVPPLPDRGPSSVPAAAPPAVPADTLSAARRWAAAVRAEAAGTATATATAAAGPAPADGVDGPGTGDAAVVDDAVRRLCGPGP
jgi:hypothetical protein